MTWQFTHPAGDSGEWVSHADRLGVLWQHKDKKSIKARQVQPRGTFNHSVSPWQTTHAFDCRVGSGSTAGVREASTDWAETKWLGADRQRFETWMWSRAEHGRAASGHLNFPACCGRPWMCMTNTKQPAGPPFVVVLSRFFGGSLVLWTAREQMASVEQQERKTVDLTRQHIGRGHLNLKQQHHHEHCRLVYLSHRR